MNTRALSSLGIPEKAAKIYIAGLELGTSTVQELARNTGLKRPTVYLHLEDLIQRGLFEHVRINAKSYYRSIDPHIIEELLEKNLRTFQSELPKLEALRADIMGKPQVQIFEGEDGIKRVYGEIKEANSVCAWSNVGGVYAPFHNAYMELAETFNQNSIRGREIIADNKESRRYARLAAKVAGPTYSVRTATAEGIENDTIIYGNVVAIFHLQGLNTFVVRIENPAIAHTMRAIFEMTWSKAKLLR